MIVRVRLVFPENLVTEPVVSRLARDFDVDVSIRRATIEEHSGWIVGELDGTPHAIESSIAWMGSAGIRVEQLSDMLEG